MKPQPGLYRSVTTLTSYDLPGASPQEADRLRSSMQALQPTTQESCLTAEQADAGWVAMVEELQGGACTVNAFDAGRERLYATLTCSTPGGVSSTMEMTGRAGETSSRMDLSIEQSGDSIPGGRQVLGFSVENTRIGDCPATAG